MVTTATFQTTAKTEMVTANSANARVNRGTAFAPNEMTAEAAIRKPSLIAQKTAKLGSDPYIGLISMPPLLTMNVVSRPSASVNTAIGMINQRPRHCISSPPMNNQIEDECYGSRCCEAQDYSLGRNVIRVVGIGQRRISPPEAPPCTPEPSPHRNSHYKHIQRMLSIHHSPSKLESATSSFGCSMGARGT